MRFWFRELAGWALVLLGLFVFYLCLALLLSERILEAGPLTFIGFIIFRGGIHLLKVAVAARVCWQAHEEIRDQAGSPEKRSEQKKPRNRLAL